METKSSQTRHKKYFTFEKAVTRQGEYDNES